MTARRKRTNPGSYAELRMWAEAFADAQAARVAFEAKDRSGTVETEAFGPVVELFAEAEKRLENELAACYRMTVPDSVRRWQEESAGIGEHTLARLLGAVGDPRMAYPKHWEGTGSGRHLVEDEPHERLVSQLWQYCGHGAVKNRDVKGDAAALMKNGRPDAKKLVYLMAAAQVKSNAKGGTRYRPVYDAVKKKYDGKVHSKDCTGGYSGNLYVKCKTHVPDGGLLDTAQSTEEVAQWAGRRQLALEEADLRNAHPLDLFRSDPVDEPAAGRKPKLGYALAGDPYQPSHKNAIALRHTGKEILRDLWLVAGGQEPVYGMSRAGEENRRKGRVRT
jgi:hypothetical protein